MKEKNPKKQLFEFGLLIGFGLQLLIGWLLPALIGHGFKAWTLWIGIPILSTGITAPHLLHYPYKVWMALSYILGWINSNNQDLFSSLSYFHRLHFEVKRI